MRLVALGGIVVFVCCSLIFGTFLIVRAVMFILPQFGVVTDVLRVVLAVALAYGWLRVWKMITDWYFWRSVGASHKRER